MAQSYNTASLKYMVNLAKPPKSSLPLHLSRQKQEKTSDEENTLAIFSTFKNIDVFIQQPDNRLFTFVANKWGQRCKDWWPKDLAEAGFYYRGNGFEVHCFSCNLITDVLDWCLDPKENPGQAHARLKPDCKHAKDNFFKLRSDIPKDMKTLRKVSDSQIKKRNTTDKTRKHNDVEENNTLTSNELTPVQNINEEFNSGISGFDKNTSSQTKPAAEKAETDGAFFDGSNVNFQAISEGQLPNEYAVSDTSTKKYKHPQYVTTFQRQKTYDEWKFDDKQKPTVLIDAGFFHTGENDVVRCFSCDLGLAEWDPIDDPWKEHARHSPKCLYLIEQKGNTYVESIQFDWKKIYNPKHAAFDDKLSRIETFKGWRTDIEQTPEILASAGFFYTGEEDVVRCHYCDGGLRHWEAGDIPWEEHAKWFPFCKFVIKMKGREYVEEIRGKQKASESLPNIETDSVSEHKINPNIFKTLKDFQIADDDIRYAANRFIQQKGNNNYSAEDLLELIFQSSENQNNTAAETDIEQIIKTNRQLKDGRKCIRCYDKDKCMLFVSCGHRVTCEECSELMDFCPVCNKKIKKRVKTFLA